MATYADMKKEEILKKLAETRKSLREFRFGISGSKNRDVRAGRNFRKEIARMLTSLNDPKRTEN